MYMKGAPGDASSCGFLALCRGERDEWVPVTGQLEVTMLAAST